MKQNRAVHFPQDEMLAGEAQHGNVDSTTLLIVRYTPLVTHCSRRFWSTRLELEDLVQEGMMGLLNAIYSYSDQVEASFKTFATRCITNKILSAVKAYYRGKNRPMNDYISLDEFSHLDGSSDTMNPQDIVIQQEDHSLWQKQISTLLSAFEQEVLELHLKGNSYLEISVCLHCTTKAVDNALQRVRRKLHAAQI